MRTSHANRCATTLVCLGLLVAAGTATAGEWNFVGARYQGMGGAGVATANDSFASYWNPAALATAQSYDGALNFDVLATVEGDAVQKIDEVEKQYDKAKSLYESVKSGANVSDATERKVLEDLRDTLLDLTDEGNGLVGGTSTGLNLRWQRYAVFSRLDGQFTVSPVADDKNVNVPGVGQTFSDITNSIVDNESGAHVRGLGVIETGVGYGHSFTVPFADMVGLESLGTFSIGANLKYLRGITYSKFVGFEDIDKAKVDFGDSDLRQESDNFGLDLGFLYRPIEIVQIGLVARNVNSPKFDTGDDPGDPNQRKDFQLDAQVRTGVAVFPFANDVLVIASDIDLTKNESDLLDGFASRIWSLGAELKLPIPVVTMALRAGGYMNAASGADHAFAFTGGLGLRVWLLSLDLAGGASPKTIEVKNGGDNFPSRVNFSAVLAVRGNF